MSTACSSTRRAFSFGRKRVQINKCQQSAWLCCGFAKLLLHSARDNLTVLHGAVVGHCVGCRPQDSLSSVPQMLALSVTLGIRLHRSITVPFELLLCVPCTPQYYVHPTTFNKCAFPGVFLDYHCRTARSAGGDWCCDCWFGHD